MSFEKLDINFPSLIPTRSHTFMEIDHEIISAKTRSDRDKLCHFWSKMKSQESQNKLCLSIASYLVHIILEGFC